MNESGTIRRIIQGIYDKPVYSELLNEYSSPKVEKVVEALARKFNWTVAPAGETALNYLFERNGKRFLYASDTGLYEEDNYSYLHGKLLNTLLMECSCGEAHRQPGFKHLTCEFIVEMVERFRRDDVINDRTEIYLTHIGHKGGLNHLELQQKMRDVIGLQVEVAHDGLRIADF